MSKKYNLLNVITLFLFFPVLFLLLCNSSNLSYVVMESISQWLTKLFPTLFPFMMLQSFVRIIGIDYEIATIFNPILGKIFNLSKHGTYCLISGFLFGFPMGAKITSEYYQENVISKNEANRLLAFCNTFSPAYYVGFVFPALISFSEQKAHILIAAIYCIPLVFGIILGLFDKKHIEKNRQNINQSLYHENITENLFSKMQLSNYDNLKAIIMIGLNMILANLLRCICFLLPLDLNYQNLCSCFFEITIGLPLIYQSPILSAEQKIIFMLALLSFGGLSGIFQAFSFITKAKLSIRLYLFHKVILIGLTILTSIVVLYLY